MISDSINGVCPIVDTPFTEDGSVDFRDLRRLSRTLAQEGSDALALFGFASEYYTLTDDERERMAEILIGECETAGIPSIISITPHATKVAVNEAERAEAQGADAIMVLPPSTRNPSTGEVLDHIRAIADAVSVPVVVQYTPSSGVSLSPESLADFYHEVPNLEYFKIESNPPGPYSSALLEQTDHEANVLVGNAGFEMIEAFDRGAVGVMPASAMYDVYIKIYERYQAGDRTGAMDVHGDLLQMLNLISQVGIAAEKKILERRGLSSTAHCRRPSSDLDEHYQRLFDEIYDEYLEPHFS